MSYNLYAAMDPTSPPTDNPIVKLTVNGTPYEGRWDVLTAEVGSPLVTEPNASDVNTVTVQGSNTSDTIIMEHKQNESDQWQTIEVVVYYGGKTPPTW